MPRARVLALALTLAALAAERTTVSLDFGWRWSLVPSATPFVYPTRLQDVVCSNQANAAGAAVATEAACVAAAAANGTMTYSFCAGGPCGAPRCLVGPSAQCNGAAYGGAGWVTGVRDASEGPAPAQAWAAPGFNDTAWAVVDLPHDAAVESAYASWNTGAQAFLPVVRAVYRKHFALPGSARGAPVFLEVDAALSTSTWWVNGVQAVVARQTGYLPLSLRLDAVPGAALAFGPGSRNLVAVYCDGGATTGWWMEGAGLTRHARLLILSSAFIASQGIATPHFVTGPYAPRATPALGLTASSVSLEPSALVFADAPATPVTVLFTLLAADGVTVLASDSAPALAGPKGTKVFAPAPLVVADAELWSIPRPYLSTLRTTLSVRGAAVDAVDTAVGLRSVAWDPEEGLRLNEQPVKPRGACEHESFAGVGAAIPDRVDLYRLQQLRGAGMQALRSSHNPYEPVLLDLADRLGVVVLGENRVLATVGNCGGNCKVVPVYTGDPAADAGAMALRDRNHASILFWSLCNEAGCGDGGLLNDTVVRAKAAIYAEDGTRAVTANMGYTSPVAPGTPMSTMLDVMGMSHASSVAVQAWHQQEPGKALVMSECCSCETQRGEDADLARSPGATFNNENSGCLRRETQTSTAPAYVAGVSGGRRGARAPGAALSPPTPLLQTFVWTAHDYLGEPGKWPHVSSSFGAYDLAGFKKAPVAWYRSWWLSNVSSSSPDRPPLGDTATTCHIVNRWQAGPGDGARDVTVYTNAPLVRLSVNDATLGTAAATPFLRAKFPRVPFAPGQLRADCLAADGAAVLASSVKRSWGAPARVVLSVDAPSPLTGTGARGALFLDGQDVALLRAAVVDAAGAVVEDAIAEVTFAVAAGPAVVWGTGNGDPSAHTPAHAPTLPAYHGLARGIVRVALVAAGSDADRALLAAVNVDAGEGASSRVAGPGAPPTAVTVTASAPGLAPGAVTIPLSVDPADAPLAAAAASVGSADLAP